MSTGTDGRRREKRWCHQLGRGRRGRSRAGRTLCRRAIRRPVPSWWPTHQRMVYALAFHLLGDRDDALDVSQEVFLRVFRTLSSFRGQSALRTWIFRIVVNQARNRQRWWNRRRRSSQVSLDEHISLCGEMPSQGEVLPDRLLASKESGLADLARARSPAVRSEDGGGAARGGRAALRRDRVLARHRGRHREVAAHPRAAGAARRAAGAAGHDPLRRLRLRARRGSTPSSTASCRWAIRCWSNRTCAGATTCAARLEDRRSSGPRCG